MRRRVIYKFWLPAISLVVLYLLYVVRQRTAQNVQRVTLTEKPRERTEDERLGPTELDNGAKLWRNSIHLSIVVCGDRRNESITLIKSAVLLTKSYIVIHIFAEGELHSSLQNQLSSWPHHITKNFEYHLYRTKYPEPSQEWKLLFKPCASQRLFIPSLLTNVDSLLYVDTDVLFLSPLEKIWSHFSRFNSSQVIAMAPDNEVRHTAWYNRFAKHPYYGELGVNSGVILMNLTRIRASTWPTSIIKYHKEYKLKMTYGDQDLMNIYFHFHPDELYIYPCEWNYRPDHCMYTSVCEGANKDGAHVLHGNRRTMQNQKQPAFKAVYSAFKEYDFQEKLMISLLPMLLRNLEAVAKTPCGKVGHIFSKRVAQFLNQEEK
ncbi:glucoside xylosyltransferase 2-like [Crassostrea angulata]|uniref:glucoside xylosyltransferase 2-like n=1 Tax=Magallana angulata TaxID=2784310 RepID=UPI0022B161A7|nr:glucoside xylosyltransferase 2-like [Crassostrea angulata]